MATNNQYRLHFDSSDNDAATLPLFLFPDPATGVTLKTSVYIKGVACTMSPQARRDFLGFYDSEASGGNIIFEHDLFGTDIRDSYFEYCDHVVYMGDGINGENGEETLVCEFWGITVNNSNSFARIQNSIHGRLFYNFLDVYANNCKNFVYGSLNGNEYDSNERSYDSYVEFSSCDLNGDITGTDGINLELNKSQMVYFVNVQGLDIHDFGGNGIEISGTDYMLLLNFNPDGQEPEELRIYNCVENGILLRGDPREVLLLDSYCASNGENGIWFAGTDLDATYETTITTADFHAYQNAGNGFLVSSEFANEELTNTLIQMTGGETFNQNGTSGSGNGFYLDGETELHDNAVTLTNNVEYSFPYKGGAYPICGGVPQYFDENADNGIFIEGRLNSFEGREYSASSNYYDGFLVEGSRNEATSYYPVISMNLNNGVRIKATLPREDANYNHDFYL